MKTHIAHLSISGPRCFLRHQRKELLQERFDMCVRQVLWMPEEQTNWCLPVPSTKKLRARRDKNRTLLLRFFQYYLNWRWVVSAGLQHSRVHWKPTETTYLLVNQRSSGFRHKTLRVLLLSFLSQSLTQRCDRPRHVDSLCWHTTLTTVTSGPSVEDVEDLEDLEDLFLRTLRHYFGWMGSNPFQCYLIIRRLVQSVQYAWVESGADCPDPAWCTYLGIFRHSRQDFHVFSPTLWCFIIYF